tara:strand:+ start:619 stop:873 length:255 start_codon:yes stop_codon:yes gene_type:complete
MGNQRKVYDDPKEATKDLFEIKGKGIIDKTLQSGKDTAAKWVEAVPGGGQVLETAKKLKEKGFYAKISPLKEKIEAGFKIKLGG